MIQLIHHKGLFSEIQISIFDINIIEFEEHQFSNFQRGGAVMIQLIHHKVLFSEIQISISRKLLTLTKNRLHI